MTSSSTLQQTTPDVMVDVDTPQPTSAPGPDMAGRPDVNDPDDSGPDANDDRRRQTVTVVAIFVAAIFALVWIWVTLTSTSASFSDTESFDGNRLGAGTLEIEVGDQTIAFAATNMAAGDRATGRFELENNGSLPLRYELTSFAPPSPLRAELEIIAWRSPGSCAATPPETAPVWRVLGTASSVVQVGALPAETSRVICMAATLPLDASDDAQGQRLDLIIGIDAIHDVAASDGGES